MSRKIALKWFRQTCHDLEMAYNFARYPDVSERLPYEEYIEEIAQEKVNLAKRIFDFLKDRYISLEGNNE